MSFVFTLSLQTFDVCLLLSREDGRPQKAQNATAITKLKPQKTQNVEAFRWMDFWQLFRQNAFDNNFFFRILQWIPENFSMLSIFCIPFVFTNFSNFILSTKTASLKSVFLFSRIHEFFVEFSIAYENVIFKAKIRFLILIL